MAQRKPYNPNTKYGRKKLREQSHEHYSSLNESEKSEYDATKFIFYLILIIVFAGLIFLLGGSGALSKWLSH